jgi:hypothetical protein
MKYALTNKETHQTRILPILKIADVFGIERRKFSNMLIDNHFEDETYIITEFVPERTNRNMARSRQVADI